MDIDQFIYGSLTFLGVVLAALITAWFARSTNKASNEQKKTEFEFNKSLALSDQWKEYADKIGEDLGRQITELRADMSVLRQQVVEERSAKEIAQSERDEVRGERDEAMVHIVDLRAAWPEDLVEIIPIPPSLKSKLQRHL